MATADTTERFACSAQQFYDMISDYESYPDFLSEVKGINIVERSGSSVLVEYHVSMIKDFKYRLKMEESAPSSIKWELDSGDIFKSQKGSWTIREIDDSNCEVDYFVEATFGMFVPKTIAKTLLSVNLPNMMKAYKKRIEELYG